MIMMNESPMLFFTQHQHNNYRYDIPTNQSSFIDDTLSMNRVSKWHLDAYKTSLCQAWIDTHRCNYANRCRYAHGVNELRQSSANEMIMPIVPSARRQQPTRAHARYKTEKCNKLTLYGFCPYGSKCHFIHGNEHELPSQFDANNTRMHQHRQVVPLSTIYSQYPMMMKQQYYNTANNIQPLSSMSNCIDDDEQSARQLLSSISDEVQQQSMPDDGAKTDDHHQRQRLPVFVRMTDGKRISNQ